VEIRWADGQAPEERIKRESALSRAQDALAQMDEQRQVIAWPGRRTQRRAVGSSAQGLHRDRDRHRSGRQPDERVQSVKALER
jgi:hypothetical protein